MVNYPNKFNVFAVCPPRLENLLAQELKGLGIKKFKTEVGGIEFSCDLVMLLRLNLWLRTASRVLVRLSRFRALHLDHLERPLSKLPWELYFTPGQEIPLHVTATHSRLHHTTAIAQRVVEALAKAGFNPLVESKTDQNDKASLLYIRVVDDIVEISLNSSGQHLYRRGYKQEVGPAPLRENLAAALLLHLGYKGQRALWDPCCGCGTIPIEAALIASRTAPGLFRSFACLDWPCVDKLLWTNELSRANDLRKIPTFPIWATDVSEKAVAMVKNNAARASVAAFIHSTATPLEATLEPPITRGGLMLANPPYGDRIQGVKGLRTVYLSFGRLCNNNNGLQGAILVDSPDLAKLASKGATPSLSFNHGGIAVTLYDL